MPANLKTKTGDGTADLTSLTFSGINPGTPGGNTEFRVLNDDTGGPVDTANEPYLIIRGINSSNEAVLDGLRILDEHWVEIRAIAGASSGSTQELTGWTPIGAFRVFQLAALPSGEYHKLEVQYNPASSAPEGEIDVLIDVEEGPLSSALSQGFSEGRRDGILQPLGTGLWDEILQGGNVVEDSPAGADVVVPDLHWIHDGIPYSKLTHDVTLNGNDGAAAALAAGEAYYAYLSLGASTTVTVTKGNKATTPLDSTDEPTLPSGEILLCKVVREFDGLINTADIEMVTLPGGYEASSSGLNLTLKGGRSVIGNRLNVKAISTTTALTASSTNYVYLLANNTVTANTTGVLPDPEAYLAYKAVTDGSSVTTLTDLRDRLSSEVVPVVLEFVDVADTTEAFAVFPRARSGYVRVDRGITLTLHDKGGSPTPNTTGITSLDLDVSDGAGGWTDLFTSKATDDRRCEVEHDDTEPTDSSAFPEVLEIPPFSRVRGTIDRSEAYDGTAPTKGATAVILVEMP